MLAVLILSSWSRTLAKLGKLVADRFGGSYSAESGFVGSWQKQPLHGGLAFWRGSIMGPTVELQQSKFPISEAHIIEIDNLVNDDDGWLGTS